MSAWAIDSARGAVVVIVLYRSVRAAVASIFFDDMSFAIDSDSSLRVITDRFAWRIKRSDTAAIISVNDPLG
jgi:hypothetical protein